MNTTHLTELLGMYTAKDELHPTIMHPFVLDGYIYATDAHILIRLPESPAKGLFMPEDNPDPRALFVYQKNCGRTITCEQLTQMLNSESIPMIDETKTVGADIICSECNGEGTVFWEYKHHQREFNCPVCCGDGYTNKSQEIPTGNKLKDPDFRLSLFEVDFKFQYLEVLLKTMQLLGVESCTQVLRNENKHNVFQIGDINVLMMPLLKGDCYGK